MQVLHQLENYSGTKCEDEEKETFGSQLDQELRAMPEGVRVIVGGYLNGHLGDQ